MEEITTDVLIIGGGPAGAAAALGLLNYSELDVVVVEQSNFSKDRIGEHVSPSLFNLLDYLKLEKKDFEEGSFLPAYGTTAFWGSDYPTTVHSIFTTESATFQLDRQKFDFRLLEQVIELGGKVFPRTKFRGIARLDNGEWQASLKHTERGNFKIQAKYLVDATGRNAAICRKLGAPTKKFDSLVGVGVFLKPGVESVIQNEQLLETTELGWWYKAKLPNGIITATFFTDADIVSEYELNKKENWLSWLNQSKHLKHHLNGAVAVSPKPWVRNAASQLTDPGSYDNFIAIGDAASSFDPISSMGIGFAMTSAIHAAKLIKHQLQGDIAHRDSKDFQKDILKNFDSYINLRTQFYTKEKRWETALFWERRYQKMDAIVDHKIFQSTQ